MSMAADSKTIAKQIAVTCGCITIATGIGILTLWTLDQNQLTRIGFEYLPAARKTGLLYTLLGCSLTLTCMKPTNRWAQIASATMAFFCALIAVLAMAHPASWMNDLDDYLKSISLPVLLRRSLTGYVAPTTACSFILTSLATLLLHSRMRTTISILGSTTIVIGWVHVLGHVHGVPLMYKVDGPLMSLTAAITAMVLGVGVVAAAGPNAWPLRSFVGDSTQARLLRWLLPLILLVMSIQDWMTRILIKKPTSHEVAASAIIDLITLFMAAIAITQISRFLGEAIDRAQAATKESEEKYRAVFEDAPEGILVADSKTRAFRYANTTICTMLGHSREELLRMNVGDIHPSECLAQIIEQFKTQARGAMDIAKEVPCKRKDGSVFFADINAKLVTIAGNQMVVGFFADITKRMRAEQALRESEARFRTLTESSLIGVCIYQDRVFKYVNPALAEMVGYAPDELLHLDTMQLVHPEDRPIADEMIRRCIEGEAETVRYSFRLICKSGKPIEIEALGRRFPYQAHPAIMSTLQDITERKRAEQALKQSRQDHARLSREREKLLEQERTRISRHLHDELGQHLTYLMLQLAHMEKRLQGVDPSLIDEFKETSKLAQTMIGNVRAVAKTLRPVAIEHDGLIPSLDSAAAEFQRISGVTCRLNVQLGDLAINELLATAIYRIVQEALTNVARHARACGCEIQLVASDGQLDLVIRDDGKGASPAALGGHRSLGIIGMKERAAALGGRLSVKKDINGGVLVHAVFPLASSATDNGAGTLPS